MKRVVSAAIIAASLGLSACVPLVLVGGVAVGAWVGADPRPTAMIKTDTELGANLSAKIIDEWKDRAHVSVNTFGGAVLLTGEVPDEAAKAKAEQIARSFPQTKRVFNELFVGPVSTTTERLNDTQLTTRVKSAIFTSSGDPSNIHIQVITDRTVVYLLGMSTPALADKSAALAASVSGVSRVVKLIQPLAPMQ
ncbi:BON domain-containing protein [Chitinibacter bivalviorum]|uniref:BON domain-containing protein n=1 Tax=Chitinibacter bivalviorum TaxID=2739434 RepID=A0A7H9BJ52_9NEIS|nr:BON domain-containing protein [Chitinibacter bivalviorum]QLG88326.1 BON domain-containing protein [Chitinibacter bivalviorum]